MNKGQHSLRLVPQILQASRWEECSYCVPGSNSQSSKGECVGIDQTS